MNNCKSILPHSVYDLIQKCYLNLYLKKPYEAVRIWLSLFTRADIKAQRGDSPSPSQEVSEQRFNADCGWTPWPGRHLRD